MIRFFQDILGYFMEKIPQWGKILILGGISLAIILIWSVQIYLYVVSTILWIVALFFFIVTVVNLIRDRIKRT